MVTNCDGKSFGSRRNNSKTCSDDCHLWRFCSAFRHFGTHFAESFHMSRSSWMMDPTLSREMLSCSAIDLAEIQRSSKINSWIWSIISGMVTVWVIQDEAHHRWKNHHVLTGPPSFWRWHTMVHVPLIFQNGMNFLPLLALQKKKNDSSRLHVVEIAFVARHAPF